MTKNKVYEGLLSLFPDAACELNYRNHYELLVAVMLSAQTTDKRVNIVTEELFRKYPTVEVLATAAPNEVAKIIASLGLFQTKTKNLIATAQAIVASHRGIIPHQMEELLQLPGVGRKTANVVLSEGFHIPAIAVDTHVKRVAKCLELTTSNDPDVVEMDLMKMFPQEQWHKLHHLMIHFGRYLCKAKKPECDRCPFECNYRKKPYNK